jgi:leucyl-tRNA synthetase
LPIKQVIAPIDDSKQVCDVGVAAYTEVGILINSNEYNGLTFSEAFEAISSTLVAKGCGERQINYRLRDWGVSRQRYWGCPIPIINCEQCGPVPVPDKDLPVELPTDVEFEGVGSPIKKMQDWYETECPNCGAEAIRETDTFDTFMESSWYYARFGSHNQRESMLDDRAKYWTPVDHYVGGEEHAILHLLYARFFHKLLRDEGLVDSDEPFEKLLALGMVLQGGTKMSKSAGDAGDPQHLMDRFGADAVRMAMMFAAPPEQSFEWSENGVASANKWLRTKLWTAVAGHLSGGKTPEVDVASLSSEQKHLRRLVHETLAKCEDDFGRRLAFNTVVAAVMSLMNKIAKFKDRSGQGRAVLHEALSSVVMILSPITPHICHKLWAMLGHGSLETAEWLSVDQSALEKPVVELAVQVNGKLRGKVELKPDAPQDEAVKIARQQGNVEKFLVDKSIRKTVYVPNRILNFVVS